ncbi:hypothetical protein [Nocardioides mesophilus]|uniref:DUF4386 domain-containing protein n=1 Tax=Nocardioides mesophilus TaxID=433659 RepID=A0A7G9RBI9_9ACTN|nr:hypothetical protein [Nocardioides mesophilus]QNN52964.1 hypothetical protein H9L09_00110 [Nocardioides mesophilus]
MNTTHHRLTAAAGACAAAAGAIFIGVQINHPPADLAHIVTTDVLVREVAKIAMSVFAMVGLTGIFIRHYRRFGVLGRAGYTLLMTGYLAMFAVESMVAVILPKLAESNPVYVRHFLDAAMGASATSDLGHMKELFMLMGLGYALGGLLFGIAMYRARVVPRWVAALLAYGTTSALALAVLPESFSRPFAVPTGVALIGLGFSMWRQSQTRTDAVRSARATEPAVA